MEHIKSERDGNLLILTLSRGKANALNYPLVEELQAAVAAAAVDDSVRGLVLAPEQWSWSSYRHYALGEWGPVLVNEAQPAEMRVRGIA